MRFTCNTYTGHMTTGFLLTAALLSGCSLISGSQAVHQSARGAVFLEEVSEWSFEANHPTMIDQNTMLKIVKGVTTDEAGIASNRLPATGSKPMRVFSDEDAEFLAPLLAQGLSRAKPEQIVGFRVSSSAGSGAAPTAGTLYVQHGAAYFTISSSAKGMRATGFMPKSAVQIEPAPSYAANGVSGIQSMVIDYQALAKASMPTSVPVASTEKSPVSSPAAFAAPAKLSSGPDAHASVRVLPVSNSSISADNAPADMTTDELLNKKMDELRLLKEANTLKESEIRMLRKEAEWMKKELRERTAERDAMKARNVSSKPTPKKKTAEVLPTP